MLPAPGPRAARSHRCMYIGGGHRLRISSACPPETMHLTSIHSEHVLVASTFPLTEPCICPQAADIMTYLAAVGRRRPRTVVIAAMYVALGVLVGSVITVNVRGGLNISAVDAETLLAKQSCCHLSLLSTLQDATLTAVALKTLSQVQAATLTAAVLNNIPCSLKCKTGRDHLYVMASSSSNSITEILGTCDLCC